MQSNNHSYNMFFEIEVSAVVSKRTVSFPSQCLHRIIRDLEGDWQHYQSLQLREYHSLWQTAQLRWTDWDLKPLLGLSILERGTFMPFLKALQVSGQHSVGLLSTTIDKMHSLKFSVMKKHISFVSNLEIIRFCISSLAPDQV